MAAASQKSGTQTSITFTGTTEHLGGRVIVRLTPEASAQLPSRGQVAVSGSANDHEFSTVIEPDGLRGHWINLDGDLVAKLGISAEATVQFSFTPTKTWPEPEIPDDLRRALAEAGDLDEVWVSLTPMARWEWVRWIKATKNPETRSRRVEVAISKLESGKRRPCCFDLASCTDPELSKSGKLLGIS